jgi:hypothetical protein
VKERLSTLLGVLLAAYVLYGVFVPPRVDVRQERPLSTEPGAFGYQGLWRWLESERIGAYSFRDRYSELSNPASAAAGAGHVMIVSIPYLGPVDHDELNALREWIAKGNTVFLAVTLNDTLPWSNDLGIYDSLDAFQYLTGIKAEARRLDADGPWPMNFVSVAVPGHWLTENVRYLVTRSETFTDAWDLTFERDSPAYTLATTPATNADAILIESVGSGSLVISTYGSLLQNSMLGRQDNRRLVGNLIRHHLAADGRVLFDDGHQGMHSIYDARAFARDPRLWGSIGLLLAFWVLYAVFAESRLGPPLEPVARASQGDFVRMLGGFLARKVAPHAAGLRLIENFLSQFALLSAGEAGATRDETWQRIEATGRIDPVLVAALQRDHERLRGGRSVNLVQLQRRLRAARRALS